MTRAPLAALAAALLLCACGKGGDHSSAAASDSAAAAAPAAPSSPSGLLGAPDVARQGVDSSNSAQQHRVDEINQLSDQASGKTNP